MKEEWRDIKGYEGLYQVSNLGRVRSLKWGKVKNKKLDATKRGYKKIALLKDNKKKNFMVHRLVITSFISNTENKLDVNHKDGNKQNNCIENLEWVTRSENLKHSFNILNRKSRSWRGGVNIFTQNYNFIISVEDSKAAAKWIRKNTCWKNACYRSICKVCNGIRKTAYGYIFEYKK